MNTVLESPLYIATVAYGQKYEIAVKGMSNPDTGELVCKWLVCGGPEKSGSKPLNTSTLIFRVLYYLSYGFLLFVAISLIKGITIKRLKVVKVVMIGLIIAGYYLALSGSQELPSNLPGMTLSGGIRLPDIAVIYMVIVLLARLVLFKKISGNR